MTDLLLTMMLEKFLHRGGLYFEGVIQSEDQLKWCVDEGYVKWDEKLEEEIRLAGYGFISEVGGPLRRVPLPLPYVLTEKGYSKIAEIWQSQGASRGQR